MLPLESIYGMSNGSEIFELEAEVDTTLSSIAFDDKAEDLRWIFNKVKYLKRKYQEVFEYYKGPVSDGTLPATICF